MILFYVKIRYVYRWLSNFVRYFYMMLDRLLLIFTLFFFFFFYAQNGLITLVN